MILKNPLIVSFIKCPSCGWPILAGQDIGYLGDEREAYYSEPSRLWPKPVSSLDYRIPRNVKESLEEAQKCYVAKAYNACAVMCGRTLEEMCEDNNTKEKILVKSLKELLEKSIIDKKIFEWAEALRLQRNVGAHAGNEKITKERARYLLDFSLAICDYVYVLNRKFEEFINKSQK